MSHHQYSESEKLHYYEGDQSKLYSGILLEHDTIDSSKSKAKVKGIWKITLFLTLITILEVTVGLSLYHSNPDVTNGAIYYGIIVFFIFFTLFKAYFIVKAFMHMGDETSKFQQIVLIPLFLLVLWLAIALLADSYFHLNFKETFGRTIISILGNHKP